MTILFLGSGSFAVPALEWLARDRPQAVQVVTLPDQVGGRAGARRETPVKSLAKRYQLPIIEVETLRGEVGEALVRSTRTEIAIVCDFRLMLPTKFLNMLQQHAYNLHGSVLPRWRGAAPIQRAILAGDMKFGVTLLRMVRALDAGPVVATREYDSAIEDDAESLERQVSNLGAGLLAEWMDRLLAGSVPLVPQTESLATFAPRIQKPEGWLNWSATSAQLVNHVRAFKPWPRSFTCWTAQSETSPPSQLFVDRLVIAPNSTRLRPGTIRALDATGIIVACGEHGENSVSIQQLQRAGRRSLSVAEFLRGAAMRVGDRLHAPEQALAP
ncbi:MAG: methionyl-tRNA formyltransferase [Planctomycetota bacterium]